MNHDVATTWPSASSEPRTRRQELTDRLVTAIVVGVFSPGDRLPPERELARLQDVSRDTVRDAIKACAALGLVESRRGRDGGTFVVDGGERGAGAPSARRTLEAELPRLADFFDYRCLVEGLVARAAAERGDDAARRKLGQLLDEFLATADPSRARDVDRRLPDHIAAMADNAHLAGLSSRLTVEATLGFASEPYPPRYVARAGAEHRDLVTAVVRGCAEDAQRIATRHFALTLHILQDGLRQVSDPDKPRLSASGS